MFASTKIAVERRQYIRVDTVLPIVFRIYHPGKKEFISDWQQGFTRNIGKGGICLEINNFRADIIELLQDKTLTVSLRIELPLAKQPVSAMAAVVWMRGADGIPGKYLIGLKYADINEADNRTMFRYARAKKMFMPVVSSLFAVLFVWIIVNSYVTIRLVNGNRVLVQQLVQILQDSSIAKKKIKVIDVEKEDLTLKIQALQLRIKTLEDEVESKQEETKRLEELRPQIDQLTKEKAAIQDKLIALQAKEDKVTEELLNIDQNKSRLEKVNMDKMYGWLTRHQNPRTGLVMSFEGDSDINNWAFIYDQSLAVQAFLNFSDFERARKTLDFFQKRAHRLNGAFVNAYYANDGAPAEYTVNSGANIWLGIAMLQYTYKTKDTRYLALAEEIAGRILELQQQDAEGGVRGGPELPWFSTEHNLDAYAFFTMLHAITEKQQYADARQKLLQWLLKHTYDKTEIPVKRGKGDATIATDTYSWSIAAIGPAKLEEIGMDPDRILEFAEQECSVETTFIRPEGDCVKIKGFDFAPRQHLARGGVISSEWTAQMVLAFKIMAEYSYKKNMLAKARTYEVKADDYLADLGKMIISSPSPSGQGASCLPYASQEYVDTGHGWMTPKGKSTGSVAGTAYTLFAYYKYNPLELKE